MRPEFLAGLFVVLDRLRGIGLRDPGGRHVGIDVVVLGAEFPAARAGQEVNV